MELTFKSATTDDVDRIFELEKKLINDYETSLHLDFEKIFDWIRRKIENNIENYECVYFNGVKVGYFFLHNEGEKLELDDFFIFEEFQGKGIGTKVLGYVNSIAKEQNKDVFLYVFTKNYRAISLYLKNGFEIIENIRDSRYIMNKHVNSCVF
ncbi:GNAT family N-acetyltransferase [Proteiniborus sp. MB09-C3]|uniref:GNAT family N-acetyltransferase n=1 Tax=Proteiniborus sp. MB09-C3 TaxID=3050072 RepID=UPI002555B0E2|nr:GNAT family N-acetyltransferase [Proteiniborus sp. MB09-C3]WIV11107.1 GNAT family N-acetyltransferase [Proteiniborus sp. MB09-C3]